MRTRLACLAAVAALVAACGGSAAASPDHPATPPTVNADSQDDQRTQTAVYEINVKLSDGRVVVCVFAHSSGYTPLGMSCDWTAK